MGFVRNAYLKKFLFRDIDKNPGFWRIVIWWELRRIPYNIIVLLFSMLFYSICTAFVFIPGGGSPIFYFLFLGAEFLLVNFYYCLFEGLDILAHYQLSPLPQRSRPKLFVLSMISLCSLIAITILYWVLPWYFAP